jgi:hypothetical protein
VNTPALIQFEGGDILANLQDRTITGLLIPYNEIGNTNIGRFMVMAGTIELPEDPAIIGINLDHNRAEPVGRATRVWEESTGIMATFAIAKGAKGDAVLADVTSPTGKRRSLSAEFHATIKAGKAIAGRLWGAANVERGAFASAMVLAADTPDVVVPEQVALETPSKLTIEAAVLPEDVTVTTPAGESAVYLPEAPPAEVNPNTEGGSTVTASAVVSAVVPSAVVPATLPGAPVLATATTPEAQAHQLGTVFAAMAQVKGGISDADSLAVLAALSDITTTGLTNGLTPPNWVGRVWQGKTYTRKFMDLCTHGTNISVSGKKGFKLDQGTALVTAWAGNKAEIGSGTASTSLVESTLRKYGFAADMAREFYDLPGGAEVIEAFVRGVVDSYAKVSDLAALNDIVKTAAWNGSGAWGSNITGVIAPATYPGVDGHNYAGAIGMLIQGITAVQDADDTPAFAIVNAAAWNQLIYTPKDLIPEFVSFGFNTDGSGSADGKVQVVKAPASGFTLGANVFTTAPSVVVGAKQAIEFDEVGETPIVLDALDIARGGIDKAVIGYLQTFIVRPESVKFIGTKNA